MTDPGVSGSAFRYVCFLAWSSPLLAAGLALFTGGFLLHRQVLPDKSVCSVEANGSCNPVPRQFSKAIVIIIDALKYEFVVYNDSLGASTAKPYQNRLPVIKNLTGGPGHLYEFLADPPTTTMQRLKGLTTGSLPTFIDLSSNFASYEINEDNIIDQLRGAGKRVVFAGDDTWMGLFPGRFTRAFPYPSFDVWDLDTVDTGVTKHLYQELKRPHAWEVGSWQDIFIHESHCLYTFAINPIASVILRSNDCPQLVFILRHMSLRFSDYLSKFQAWTSRRV